MEIELNGLNAIGYSIEDYTKMFGLTEDELNMKILDCYAGTSAFCAQMHAKNLNVVACDPLYSKPLKEIKKLMEQADKGLLNEIQHYASQFADTSGSAQEFIKNRQNERAFFLQDFPKGLKSGRYKTDVLPDLSFTDEQFDLALVGQYLFTYPEQFTVGYLIKAIQALTRVANEVRIFPLVTRRSVLSIYVGEVASILQSQGLGVEIRAVPFEFQKNGNAMLRIWTKSCSIAAHVSRG